MMTTFNMGNTDEGDDFCFVFRNLPRELNMFYSLQFKKKIWISLKNDIEEVMRSSVTVCLWRKDMEDTWNETKTPGLRWLTSDPIIKIYHN